jgi:hypothetical protein
MKYIKALVFIMVIGLSLVSHAQGAKAENKAKVDKKSYYQKRALEDAKYEQQFKAESKTEEETLWKEQQRYEKDLKKRDRKAYKTYMKEKRNAYARHYEHCDNHCHHSDSYYQHASIYYYRYYDRPPRRNGSVYTNVRIRTPKIGLGIGIF